jgi:hypothetical protein
MLPSEFTPLLQHAINYQAMTTEARSTPILSQLLDPTNCKDVIISPVPYIRRGGGKPKVVVSSGEGDDASEILFELGRYQSSGTKLFPRLRMNQLWYEGEITTQVMSSADRMFRNIEALIRELIMGKGIIRLHAGDMLFASSQPAFFTSGNMVEAIIHDPHNGIPYLLSWRHDPSDDKWGMSTSLYYDIIHMEAATT